MRRLIAFFGVTALLMSAFPGVATADNWSGATGNTGCSSTLNKADNKDHYLWYGTLTNATENAANAARQDNVNPTNVDTHMASSLTSATDVVVYDEYYELYCNIDWAYNAAFTECASLNPADECEQHQIRVNLDAIDALTTAQEKAMMCMEFGHSLGLKHRQVAGSTANGCMDNNHYYQDFTGHDVDHLNSHYN